MATFLDQCGRKVDLAGVPERIVSTVPSQTELLYSLGLGSRVIGITAYCVHPKECLQEKTVIGGTKDLQIDKIRALKPDLILGNKEENIKEQIEALADDIPVWLSDIVSLDQAQDMIDRVAEICGVPKVGATLNLEIKALRAKAGGRKPIKALYFIWKDPYMVAGPDTFISHMMQAAGYENCAPANGQRYPSLEIEDIENSEAEVLLLSSEPYAFKTQDSLDLHPTQKRIRIVDGELFSWYGSRMKKALQYFNQRAQ